MINLYLQKYCVWYRLVVCGFDPLQFLNFGLTYQVFFIELNCIVDITIIPMLKKLLCILDCSLDQAHIDLINQNIQVY